MLARQISAIHVIGVLAIVIGFMFPVSAAQASWLDRVKDIYQLPENVEQIQKDYEATKQQLKEQKDKLSETIRHSQETEEKLLKQNEALQKENQLLQERLKAMEQVALDKEKRNRKITNMVIAAVLLVVLYFVLGRVFRYVVWRRQKRHMR
ncbi:DNA replication initiation control protein YabA [Paenibacillus aceris]|uniref:Septal ring factor EnvC (AmiA/AmiB activator) n=1 Tax=Paenibacillus aceris TaxID=869555 RepID=A0ABS4IAJ0_9BACL|nr:DNA replication initiation control protein YabA [Paenibacillus aceris]MBP1967890.1 septal ring factor EnvC (AmiA/AmiB activator) [Paenibacillus aceris]NHW39025.1 DNA replication initiation control protein YabA [Paenibacillus aceris]